MLSKLLLGTVVTAMAVVAVLTVNVYRAGQQLSRTLDVARSDAPAPSAAPLSESSNTESERASTTASAGSITDNPPDSDWPDAAESFKAEAADENLDPLTSIQALLNDPDPEVRSEAAALLQVWQAESAPPALDLPSSEP